MDGGWGMGVVNGGVGGQRSVARRMACGVARSIGIDISINVCGCPHCI